MPADPRLSYSMGQGQECTRTAGARLPAMRGIEEGRAEASGPPEVEEIRRSEAKAKAELYGARIIRLAGDLAECAGAG
jgi:hypothetical protein